MAIKKIRLILLSSSMLIIYLVLGFTSYINIVSFQQSHQESIAANYKVLANQTVRKIEYAIKYGKPLTNFYGIEEILNTPFNKVDFLKHSQVVLPSGEIIYNENGFVGNKYIAEHLREKVNFLNVAEDVIYSLDDENYYIFSPIYDENGRWIATLNLVFDDQIVSQDTNRYVLQSIYIFSGFFFLIFMTIFLFLKKIPIVTKEHQLLKKRVVILIVAILSSAQIVFGVINYFHLKDGYLNLVTKNTSLTLNVIKNEIEDVLSKGVLYRDLYGLGDYMNGMIESISEISRISVVDADFSTEEIRDSSTNTKYSYSTPLMNDALGEKQYVAVVDLSKEYIDKRMQEILLDMLTVIVLSMLLIVEFIHFILFYLERRMNTNDQKKSVEVNEVNRGFIRSVSVMTFASVCLTFAYIPLLMNELIAENGRSFFVLSAPLLAELMFILLAFFIAMPICNRTGWRNLYIIGAVVIIVGSLASAISWNSITFVLARSVAGLGFGFVIVSFYRFSFYYKFSQQQNKETFSLFQSGAIVGMFFGIVGGAMLAERIGLFTVFYTTIPIILLAIIFVLKFIPNFVEKRYVRRRLHFYTLEKRMTFITNVQVHSTLLFILIPASIISMFFFYIVPIIAKSYDFSVANIGRLFIFQGLFYLLLMPIYEEYIAKFIRPKTMIVITFFLFVIGFLIYAIQSTMGTFLFMVILIGIGHSIGSFARQMFFNHLELVSLLDEDKKVGYYYFYMVFSMIVSLIMLAVAYSFFLETFSFIFFSALIFIVATILIFTTTYKPNKLRKAM